MSEDHRTIIDLHLRDIGELFLAPELDPMMEQFHTTSGVDRALAQARPLGLRPLTINITVADPVDDGTAQHEQVSAALRGYCTQRARDLDPEIDQIRRRGRKELVFGLMFLAACLGLSGVVEVMSIGPEWVRHISTEGLVIVGWISLWHPVDMLLFERWPLVKDQRVLTRIADARIRIRTEVATSS